MFKKLALCGVMILGLLSSFNMPNAHAETTVTYAIDPKYILAEPFSEGLAAVYGTGGWGFVDKNGKEIIKLSYTGAKSFSEGLAPVNVAEWGKGDKWGYIDQTGKIVIQPKYSIAKPFVGGYAVVYSKDRKAGVINKQGKVVINLKYDNIKLYDGIAITDIRPTKEQGYSQALDMTGKALFKYPSIGIFKEGLGVYATYSKRTPRYGFIDKTGKIVIKAKYEQILAFSEGLAPVKQNDKWGFIDKQGKVIIKPQYYDALPFSEGLAAVNGTGGWGFIDKNGKKVVKPKYYSVKAFSDGLAAVELSNRKWGFIDKTGKMVIDAQFFNVTETNNLNDTGAFREGLSAVFVSNKDNKRWGYILNPLNKP
ncbi:WG repeat-containing protein [Paenibacillus xylanilyticus]|uniref:WG repeat-containing protein n=1 Tax=Paenibacillus xylanilyticus TaxID=248903 RepID=A0A7Y6EU69_9BACL|nr:WG repeat-containing protein [Paenibacillus xylanilyticus]NUU75326.1 WG repeat-containing protein [Paenibacillus xylanilyticus]